MLCSILSILIGWKIWTASQSTLNWANRKIMMKKSSWDQFQIATSLLIFYLHHVSIWVPADDVIKTWHGKIMEATRRRINFYRKLISRSGRHKTPEVNMIFVHSATWANNIKLCFWTSAFLVFLNSHFTTNMCKKYSSNIRGYDPNFGSAIKLQENDDSYVTA